MQGARPVSAAENGCADVPEPADWPAVVCPYDVVVPHSKETVVATPFGFAVPSRVAPVVVTPVADPVATVGAGVGAGESQWSSTNS